MQVVWNAAAVAALLIAVHGSAANAQNAPESLTWAQSIQALDESNRAVRIARRQFEASTADIRRADVSPNPNLSLALSNTTPRRYRVPDTDWILRLEQLVERGGKRELRTAVARELARAASLDIRDIGRQQRAQLGMAYFDLVAAQQAVALSAESLAGYQRVRAAAERRLQAGDIAAVDVSRLRVEEGRAQNEARVAAANLEQARIALASLLGQESRAESLSAADPFLDLDENLPGSGELARAIDRRADVASLKARIEALEQTRRLAIAQRTRDVTIGVQTERSPSLGGQVFGLSATIPLFLNNDFSGDIARAQADLATAREDLERVQALVRSEASRAAALAQSALERARRIETASLPQATRAAQAIEFAFGRGAATLTDLFDARRQLTAVRLEALLARADHSKAVIAWREAVHSEETP